MLSREFSKFLQSVIFFFFFCWIIIRWGIFQRFCLFAEETHFQKQIPSLVISVQMNSSAVFQDKTNKFDWRPNDIRIKKILRFLE